MQGHDVTPKTFSCLFFDFSERTRCHTASYLHTLAYALFLKPSLFLVHVKEHLIE